MDGSKRHGRIRLEDEVAEDTGDQIRRAAMLAYLKSLPDFLLILRIVDGDKDVTYRKLAEEINSNPGTLCKQKERYFREVCRSFFNNYLS
jgi:hypothetical protein